MSRGPMFKTDELSRRIAKLSRLVAEARDLSRVTDYYLDWLAPDPRFVAEGVRATHQPLTAIVRCVARAYGCELPDVAGLLHAPRFSLWHGVVGLCGPMAFVLYFDDQHRGVVHFGGARTHRVRFSLPEEARDPEGDLGNVEFLSLSPARQRGST